MSNTSGQSNATYPKFDPPHSTSRNDTFRTTCDGCKMQFEYSTVFANFILPCRNCGLLFIALETPLHVQSNSARSNPFSLSEFIEPQKMHQVHNIGSRVRLSGLGSSRNLSQEATLILGQGCKRNVVPSASLLTAQAADVTHSASLIRESSEQKESQVVALTEESLRMRFQPSPKTEAGLGTEFSGSVSIFAAKKHGPKKRHRDETEKGIHMAMGNEGERLSSFPKGGFKRGRMNIGGSCRSKSIKGHSKLGIRNIMMQMAKKEICRKIISWNSATQSDDLNKPKASNEGKHLKGEGNGNDALNMKPDAHKFMEFVDIKSSIELKKSYTVESDTVPAKNEPEPKSMIVPDSDFHDFDQDLTEKSFGENQVWAAYDDDDGMPRYYAMIHGVISIKPFKLRMSWLNSKSNTELAPLNWIGSGFYKTSGDFRIGKHEVNKCLNSFSHKVKWSKSRKGAIQIYPRKGDVWALYRNWSPDWNEETPDDVIHKYDMVKVLEDYNEQDGVAVAPLLKVPGFKTVFRNHSISQPSKTMVIGREELFRFSHQVPSYMLTGQEAQNSPKGCLELDPAATPSELLQVLTEAQVKEMEVVKNDPEMKPNITVGSSQAAMEEKENKKPGPLLVYCRRRPRKG